MARKPNTELRNEVLALLAKKHTHYEASNILTQRHGRRISPQLVSYYSKPVSLEKKQS